MARRRGHRSGERFVALPHWLLRSPAWRALSPNAKAVLLHIWERHNGSNNGQIVYAVREAADIGVSRPTAARALSELIDLGFLRVTRSSSFTLKTKEAREWALTAEPLDGRSPTKDFMKWVPAKRETRSHQLQQQSHQRDHDAEAASKSGFTVSPAGPSALKKPRLRSHQRDTSSIPSGSAMLDAVAPSLSVAVVKQKRPPRFGDTAKAERTVRAPMVKPEDEKN